MGLIMIFHDYRPFGRHRLKTLGIVFVILFLTFSQGLCSEKQVVLSTFNYSPYMDESLPSKGMFPEIAVKAYQAVGYDAVIKFYPLKRSIYNIKKGLEMAELGTLRHYDPEEVEAVPVFYCKIVGFYKKDKYEVIRFKTLKDLRGYRIGVYSGGSDYNLLKADETLDVEGVNSIKQLFFKIFYADRQDIVFVTDLAGISFISKYFHESRNTWSMTDDVLLGFVAHVCFSKKYPKYKPYMDKFKEGLDIISKNGELYTIYESYFGKGKVPADIDKINSGDYVLPVD